MTVLVYLTSAPLECCSQSTDVIIKTKLTRDKIRRVKVFCEKGIFKNLKKFTEYRQCRSLFLRQSQLYLKEAPTKVGFCEFCKIFKSTYFAEYLRTASSL